MTTEKASPFMAPTLTLCANEKENAPVDESARSGWNDTRQDEIDMQRLGKKQEFNRNFGFMSTLGFVSIYMATWEFVLVSLSAGLINGGLAGLFWMFLGTVLCYSTVVLSLAEMESMAPTSGGQYHWTSEFAPPKYQKLLSYASGWQSSLGWIASTSSAAFVVTTLVEAMIIVERPEFAFLPWQYTLLMLGFLFVTIFLNTWGAKILPGLHTFSLFAHIGGFFITFIALWVMCPRNAPRDVFINVVNSGGWSNTGTSCLISQVTVIYCNIGSDSIVHISEEVEDASLVVPRAMWWSFVVNVFFGILMLVTMLFCIGPLDDVLESGVPYLTLFLNTGSTRMALFLTILVFLLIAIGNVTCLATCSREVWAFSRDKGFPFSNWISRMNRKQSIPYNSVYLSSALAGVLCLINLGSSFAFNIIVSLILLAILSTYMLSIGCLIHRRLSGKPLPHARWSLGRFGLPINIFAFFYSGFVIVFACFPVSVPVTLDSANWAPLVWAGVIILAIVAYIVHGRTNYTPPVEFVEGKRGNEIGFQSVN